jgi:hypothetical protein
MTPPRKIQRKNPHVVDNELGATGDYRPGNGPAPRAKISVAAIRNRTHADRGPGNGEDREDHRFPLRTDLSQDRLIADAYSCKILRADPHLLLHWRNK